MSKNFSQENDTAYQGYLEDYQGNYLRGFSKYLEDYQGNYQGVLSKKDIEREMIKYMAEFYETYHKKELRNFFLKSLLFPYNESRLNPVYQRKCTKKVWERIEKWENGLMRNHRLRFYHVTLTVPNIECTELSRAWRAMNKAVNRLLALKQFRGCHRIRKFEADYVKGAKENTHPHIHIFIATEKNLDDFSREELAYIWQRKLEKEGYCVDISHEAQYIKRATDIGHTMFYVTKSSLFSNKKGDEFISWEEIKQRFSSLGGAYADWLEVYNKEMRNCRDISYSKYFS